MRARLIAAGIAVFLIALIALLPARVLGFLLPPEVATGTLTGSVWRGATDALAVNGRALGPLQWTVRPLHLLRGRLALDATLGGGAREVRGRFAFGLGGAMQAWNVDLRWPVSALPVNAIPPGWNGDLQAVLREAVIEDGQVKALVGIVDARNLGKTVPEPVALGSYRLTFDEDSAQAGALTGKVQDMDGPLQVTGTLTLDTGRRFLLDVLVATRPGATQAINNALRFLGEPDAQGRRPFSIDGTY